MDLKARLSLPSTGHKNMRMQGILHRDISARNILHGASGASDGIRGKPIDFEMALQVHGEANTTNWSRTVGSSVSYVDYSSSMLSRHLLRQLVPTGRSCSLVVAAIHTTTTMTLSPLCMCWGRFAVDTMVRGTVGA